MHFIKRFIYLIITKENHVSKNIGKSWFRYKESIKLKNVNRESEYLLQKKKKRKKNKITWNEYINILFAFKNN